MFVILDVTSNTHGSCLELKRIPSQIHSNESIETPLGTIPIKPYQMLSISLSLTLFHAVNEEGNYNYLPYTTRSQQNLVKYFWYPYHQSFSRPWMKWAIIILMKWAIIIFY